ncbi:MAG: hypothetical protein GY796_13730 [Chloroflexi bacterium]|nr:hypothetical protein [Chloroflexota bacterium]
MAAEMGLSYTYNVGHLLPKTMQRYYFAGPTKTLFQFVDGLHGWHKGVELFVFDARVQINDQNGRKKQRPISMIMIVSPALRLPHFSIIPIHDFVLAYPVFGYEKISFRQKDIQFANLYVVQGQEENQVKTAVNQSVRAQMKQLINRSCEGKGDQLIFYYEDHCILPERLPEFIDQAYALYDLFAFPQKDPKDF